MPDNIVISHIGLVLIDFRKEVKNGTTVWQVDLRLKYVPDEEATKLFLAIQGKRHLRIVEPEAL
jgi:hypothetical protein